MLALGQALGLPFQRGLSSASASWLPSDATGSNLEQWLYDTPGDASPWYLDKSQTGDDRILNGGPGLQRGQCLDFDGVNQHVDLGAQAAPANITLAFWSAATGHVNDDAFQFGKAKIQIESSSRIKYWPNTSVGSKLWAGLTLAGSQHICVTQTGSGDPELFIDGVSQGTVSNTTPVDTTSSSSYIGRGASYFEGKIWDARVYSRALTDDEITHVYSGGAEGTDPTTDDVDGWWKLDEQSGVTAYDSSGNGNHGTLINSPSYTTQDVYSWQNSAGYTGAWAPDTTVYRDASAVTSITCKVFVPSGAAQFVLFDDGAGGSSRYLVCGQDGDTSSPITGTSGTPTVKVDGVTVTTRDEVYDTLADGALHDLEITGLDLSAWAEMAYGGYGFGYDLAAGAHIIDLSGDPQPTNLFIPRDESDTANDVLGNALTYAGSAPRHGRISGPCLTLSGTQYANTGVHPPSSGYLEVRFKYTGSSGVLLGGNDGSGNACTLGISGNRLGANIGTGTWLTIVDPDALVSGTWYKAKVTWDGANVELFKAIELGDYVSVYSGAQTGSIPTSTDIYLGANNNNGTANIHFTGDVCDFNINGANRWPICERSGTFTYDTVGSPTVIAVWLNTPTWSTQDVFDWRGSYGFTRTSVRDYPGYASKNGDDVQGNPLGVAKISKYLDIDFNPYTIPSLSAASLDGYDMDGEYSGVFNLTTDDTHKVDQHFSKRQGTSLATEYILYDGELSGDDWNNIHSYCLTVDQLNARLAHLWTMNALDAGTPATTSDEVGSLTLNDSDDGMLASTVSGTKSGNALTATWTGGSLGDGDALDATAPAGLDTDLPISHWGWVKMTASSTSDNIKVMDQNAGSQKIEVLSSNGYLRWTYNGQTISSSSAVNAGSWHFYLAARDSEGNLTFWLDGEYLGQQVGVTMPSGTGTFRLFDDSDDNSGEFPVVVYDEHGAADTTKLRDNHVSFLHFDGTGKFLNTTSNEYE